MVAALSHSIEGIILGRALQGMGAIGSTTIALLADLTREQNRTKAMATIGLTVGFSFSLAMVIGPVLNVWVGIPGIFWLTAMLAVVGIYILFQWVPTPTNSRLHRDTMAVPELFKLILTNTELLRLDLGIFMLHAILTASFIAVPIALQHIAGLPQRDLWYVYLPVLVLAFIAMLPFMHYC